MSDILSEVKDDLRYENTLNLIRKFLPFAIVLILSIIIIICLRSWWTSYQESKLHKDGSSYMVAIKTLNNTKNLKDATDKFEELGKGDSNYSAISNLNIASYAIFQKDFEKAIKYYSLVENNSSFGAVFKEYARLQNIIISYESSKIDTVKTISNLEKYIKDNAIFAFTAKEFLLNIYIKEDKFDLVKKISNELVSDTDTPSTIVTKVKEIQKLANKSK